MTLEVTIEFRDDKTQVYTCYDFPNMDDWVTIYCANLTRQIFPKDAIKQVTIKVVK